MSLELQLEIEGLTDKSWARIERRLFERAAAEKFEPTRAPPQAGAGVGWWMALAMTMAGATAAIGGALVWHALSVPPRAPVQAPWRVTTGASGAHVDLGEVGIDLSPQSDVVVRAVGADFAAARTAYDVDVQVQRGVVRVTQGERHADIGAGEAWSTRVESPAETRAPWVTSSEPEAPLAKAPAHVRSPGALEESARRFASWRSASVDWVVY
jgi:hypothetical protein